MSELKRDEIVKRGREVWSKAYDEAWERGYSHAKATQFADKAELALLNHYEPETSNVSFRKAIREGVRRHRERKS